MFNRCYLVLQKAALADSVLKSRLLNMSKDKNEDTKTKPLTSFKTDTIFCQQEVTSVPLNTTFHFSEKCVIVSFAFLF